jgi:hypothetical protein
MQNEYGSNIINVIVSLQLIEEAEVSGSDEEMEEEEEKAEKEGESSGSELEPVQEDEVSIPTLTPTSYWATNHTHFQMIESFGLTCEI